MSHFDVILSRFDVILSRFDVKFLRPVVPNLHLGGKLRVTVPSGMSLVSDLPTLEEWMSQGGEGGMVQAWGADVGAQAHLV